MTMGVQSVFYTVIREGLLENEKCDIWAETYEKKSAMSQSKRRVLQVKGIENEVPRAGMF